MSRWGDAMPEPRKPDAPWGGEFTPVAAARLLAALTSPAGSGSGPGAPEDNGEPDDGSPPVALDRPARGVSPELAEDSLPGYTICERLGAGAGGVVYRALREGSERPVALKILSRALGAGPGAQRAWRELDLLSQLHLPSVPRVIDYGVHEGRLYIATEHIEGAPLDVHCRGESEGEGGEGQLQRRDLRATVSLLARIADAVHSLHERGVIHRDLKPSNILVDRHGDPVIIDLGIAALAADDVMQTLTVDGAPLGTPAFMAPEQARGDRSAISTRSDVYGLGATACLILTGQTPHDVGTTLLDAVRRIADEDPRDPRELDPALPRPLAAVIAKALSRDPAGRYASAADLAADLRRWLNGEPVEAHPPGAWRRAWRWMGRRPLLTTAAASVILAAGILGGTVASVRWLYAQPHRVTVSPDRRTATVLSRLGAPLREWHSEGRGIILAQFLDRPAQLGGGRVIVTAMSRVHGSPRGNNQLAVWDPRRLAEPLWVTSSSDPALRAPRTRLPPLTSLDLLRIAPEHEEYEIGGAIVADIFPTAPGLEIAVTQKLNPIDPTCFRVYDLAGQVLFEVWHWGTVGPALWLPEPRLLVLAGSNNEHRWPTLGAPAVEYSWPHVVLAVRPERGARHKWVNPRMAEEGEQAIWYRCLLPAEATDSFRGRAEPAHQPKLRESHFLFNLHLSPEVSPDQELATTWTIDRRGEITHRQPADPYRQALARGEEWPDIAPLHLGDLPEPAPPAKPADPAAAPPQDDAP